MAESELQYSFAVCQPQVRDFVKKDVLLHHPGWAPAFFRKGFVTWGCPGEALDLKASAPSPFARCWGQSLGNHETLQEVVALARTLHSGAVGARATQTRSPLIRLHVYDPTAEWEEDPVLHTASSQVEEVCMAIRRLEDLQGPVFFPQSRACPDDLVLSVMLGQGRGFWLGLHRHTWAHGGWPGGIVPVEMPGRVPSRAYRKLEETRLWYDIPFRRGDVAVEVGSAPGGAAHALLRQGVRVVGIDPGPMDPQVLEYEGPGGAKLTHVSSLAGKVRREDLPVRVDWLLIDANMVPQVALHTIHRLADKMRSTLMGVIFTLKMNDLDQRVHIPALLRRIEAMGVLHPMARQLPSHRMELCVFGLSVRGERRRSG